MMTDLTAAWRCHLLLLLLAFVLLTSGNGQDEEIGGATIRAKAEPIVIDSTYCGDSGYGLGKAEYILEDDISCDKGLVLFVGAKLSCDNHTIAFKNSDPYGCCHVGIEMLGPSKITDCIIELSPDSQYDMFAGIFVHTTSKVADRADISGCTVTSDPDGARFEYGIYTEGGTFTTLTRVRSINNVIGIGAYDHIYTMKMEKVEVHGNSGYGIYLASYRIELRSVVACNNNPDLYFEYWYDWTDVKIVGETTCVSAIAAYADGGSDDVTTEVCTLGCGR